MIDCKQFWCSRRCWILTATALVYFVIFPSDLEALLTPLRTVLTLSDELSRALYGLAAVVVACWTAHAIWARREQGRPQS